MFETYLSNIFTSVKTPYLFGDASGVLTRRQSKGLVDRVAHTIHARTSSFTLHCLYAPVRLLSEKRCAWGRPIAF